MRMVPRCAAPQVSSWARPWKSAALASTAPAIAVLRPSPSSVAPAGCSPYMLSAALRAIGTYGVSWHPSPMP